MPMRRCIGCRESKPQSELMRFTVHEATIVPDGEARSEGKGYYLCLDEACFELALKRKAFNRICRCNVDIEQIKSVIGEKLLTTKEDMNVKES